MSLISRAADAYYTYKFIRILTQKWEDMEAHELGLIDADGKKIKSPETSEEKSAYSLFHRLAFNVKRILEKLPFGKTKLASYAAALYLLKENTGISEYRIKRILEAVDVDLEDMFMVTESFGELVPGEYRLSNAVVSPLTGEVSLKENSTVVVQNRHIDTILGVPIYEAVSVKTGEVVYISSNDVRN